MKVFASKLNINVPILET